MIIVFRLPTVAHREEHAPGSTCTIRRMRLEPSGDTNSSFETAQVFPQHVECVPRMLRSPARGISARNSSTSFAFRQLEIDGLITKDADVFVFGGKQHQLTPRTLDDAKKRRGELALIGARSGGRLAAPSEEKGMTPLLLLPAIW